MLRTSLFSLLALTFVTLTAIPAQDATSELAAKLDAFCAPLVEAEVVVGLVVGVFDGDAEFVRGYGKLSRDGDEAPDGGTLYEIGSISKVFTGLLLADAVERGLVALDDPVQKYLPEGVTLRPWRGKDILLWHLSTHTSGLPRMPRDEAPDANDPFAHYGIDGIHAAINDARARREPGTIYEYSNLGAGILGYVVMRVNGCSTYDEVLARRITGPLGMVDTAVVLSERLQSRFAPPHDGDCMPSHAWSLAMMAGAGGIRSTASDMLKFARFELDPGDSPLAAAIALSQEKRHDGQNGIALALGWHIARDGESLVHTGQTGGYHAYVGIVPSTKRIVCMLTNAATGQIDVVGERLIQSLSGMQVAPPEFEKSVAVDRQLLQRLAGRYRLVSGLEFDVTLRDEGLFAKLGEQPAFRLHPRSPTEFFYRVVPASITFDIDGDVVTQLVLHQNGLDMPYKRIVEDRK